MSAEGQGPLGRAQFLTASAAVAASAAILPLAALADEDTVRDFEEEAFCNRSKIDCKNKQWFYSIVLMLFSG